MTIPRVSWYVLAMGAVLLFMARMPGMMTLMLAVPMLIWSVRGLLRRPRLHPMAVYMLASLLAAVAWGGQYCRSWSIGQDASVVAQAVVQYHDRTGHYPAQLEGIGYNTQQARFRLGLYYRLDEGGRPALMYQSPWTVFETNHYDFAQKSWHFVGD
ncbi:hypothetical protein [Leeia aquatica]|uniref:Uncharacterized protein n=1 Tax=Leeia aquatica TaxID=2725557 RepID=A0A847S9C4_9NEIS|nr:hypothetical protein [Leeia aquatica]NLR74186.1 hypothetical protein [Leeia aquatica]